MSISMYQSTVSRLQKEISDLRKKTGDEHIKQSRIAKDIESIDRSIKGSSSLSTIESKLRDRSRKQEDYGKSVKKLGDLEAQISNKTSSLNQALNNLERLQNDARKRLISEDKKRDEELKKRQSEQKRRDEENLKREKEITKEREKQSRFHNQMRMSRFSIDLTKLPTKIKVLFVAANPLEEGLAPLGLDEEIRLIHEKLRASEYRESVELKSRWAVRPTDLLQAFNEEQPHIVHFSGHGTDTDEIVFVGNKGEATFVTKEAMMQFMSTMADNLQVVVFNTCFSAGQAEAITQNIDVAIGMNTAIGDEAARVFAAQFYSAIGFGKSVQNAFDQAKMQLIFNNIPEENTPQLFVRDGIDANEVILVRP